MKKVLAILVAVVVIVFAGYCVVDEYFIPHGSMRFSMGGREYRLKLVKAEDFGDYCSLEFKDEESGVSMGVGYHVLKDRNGETYYEFDNPILRINGKTCPVAQRYLYRKDNCYLEGIVSGSLYGCVETWFTIESGREEYIYASFYYDM